MDDDLRTETVLIVAKTRQGSGACIGGITAKGRSVRLIAADAASNEHAGKEYEVGEVWEVQATPATEIVSPHVENIIVHSKQKLRVAQTPQTAICRFMAPRTGGPEVLYDGLVKATESGALYIAQQSGVPAYSTMFWRPDQDLERDDDGKRIRYRYATPEGGRTLTFVGFQEPRDVIPAGSLVRVSLAHWWRPPDRPDRELRCFVQLSGWFLVSEPDPCGPDANAVSRVTAASPRAEPLQTAKTLLKTVFGYDDFWPVQAEVIANLLQGRDTLAVMPTGGGKSLCYQLPSLLHEGLTVVISPLIALMQDQVDALRELGIPAVYLNSTLDYISYAGIARQVKQGEVKLLYVSPETLLRPETLVMLDQCRVSCLTIDEAHCISTWGHDFRPEYRQLLPVRQRYPQAVCLALTATATPRVQNDIAAILGITTAGRYIASFNRSNLFLAVAPRRGGLQQVLDFLEAHREQAGIIYCSTRDQTETLAAQLADRGWSALPYHAGLDSQTRLHHQRAFARDDVDIIVATIAFGMGINKSNVRFILHYNLPKDIESYYQEIGRAGRDGLPADCLLLFSPRDVTTIGYFIREGAKEEQKARFARLDQLVRFAQAGACRRQILLTYFGEKPPPPPCNMCDHCAPPTNASEITAASPQEPTGVDVTVPARKFLSCVQDARERFGANHVIRVLRGSRAKEALRFHDDQFSSYGSGREYSEDHWKEMVSLFLQLGLVTRDSEYGTLHVTAAGEGVLRGDEVWSPAETKIRHATGQAQPRTYDVKLFEKLRLLRKSLADEAGVPPYVVFSDRTLVHMCARLPQSPTEFLNVPGVGQHKLERYGDAFLDAIRTHRAEGGQVEMAAVPEVAAVQIPGDRERRRYEQVGELFAAGDSIEELQEAFVVQRSTILHHLYSYQNAGGSLDPDRILRNSGLTPAQQDRVLALFAENGDERLTPIFEALDAGVSYEELHVMRLYRRATSAQTPVSAGDA